MKKLQIIPIENHSGRLGDLTVIENLPFEIKRVFWIYNVPANEMRGGHAHKKCHQFLVPVYGAVMVKVDKHEFILDDPTKGLYIPPGYFSYIYFLCENTTLVVFASERFREDDYLYAAN